MADTGIVTPEPKPPEAFTSRVLPRVAAGITAHDPQIIGFAQRRDPI
jgi:hypothetical protein